MVLIYKKVSRSDPSNYCPISLKDSMHNISCRDILDRTTAWFADKDILHHLQSGFSAGNSTVDQVFCFLLIKWKVVDFARGSLYVSFGDLHAAQWRID